VKWGVVALIVLSIAPLSQWLRRRPEKVAWVCFALGLLPFITEYLHLFMATVSWPSWAGYSTGIEITLEDLLAVLVFVSIRNKNSRIPFLLPMALYLAATLIASVGAMYTTAALFYCWQLLRIFFIYIAVFTAVSADFTAARALLIGMACGELVELGIASWQRVGLGMLQAHGTMESQNELGLVSHFVMFPFFAILLGGRRGWLPGIVVLAGLVVETLTTSRGTVMLGVAGLALTYALSSMSKWSSRKALVALAGLAILAAAVPFALASFEQRFSGSGGDPGLAEDSERIAYKTAAAMMFEDFPGGVGPNHFTVIANAGGYYIRAGEAPYSSGLAGRVHNVYWLVLAESGILGLVTYLGFLLFPLVMALRYGVGGQRESSRDLLLGLGVTLIIVYIHSWEEWVPITYTMQNLLAINFGLVAALAAKYRVPRASAIVLSPIIRLPPI
jgi:O-antigen ligase